MERLNLYIQIGAWWLIALSLLFSFCFVSHRFWVAVNSIGRKNSRRILLIVELLSLSLWRLALLRVFILLSVISLKVISWLWFLISYSKLIAFDLPSLMDDYAEDIWSLLVGLIKNGGFLSILVNILVEFPVLSALSILYPYFLFIYLFYQELMAS